MVEIKVVDSIMGSGKTSWAIQHINDSKFNDKRFIYITPFLDEVKRIKSAASRRLYDPIIHAENGETIFKLDHFHKLLAQNNNIVSTHSLFKRANSETKDLIHAGNYILILDEVMNVIEEIDMKKNDLEMLINEKLIWIDDNKFIHWNEEKTDYDSRYNDIRDMALNNSLIYFRDKVIVWNFPIDVFKSFKEVYILTYMFKAQLQRYYYDLHDVEYKTLHVEKNKLNKYKLVEGYGDDSEVRRNLIKKINIYDGNLNDIGDKENAFSKSWYLKKSSLYIKKIKNNIFNYFHHKIKSNSNEAMWTTFDSFKGRLRGAGYTKGYIACNSRATNNYRHKHNLAYMVNRYCHPMLSGFFKEHGIDINNDNFAISEMVQWIWRSSIRDDKDINIYIPSSRMRKLLIDWLNK
jgi:hypothetical protein